MPVRLALAVAMLIAGFLVPTAALGQGTGTTDPPPDTSTQTTPATTPPVAPADTGAPPTAAEQAAAEDAEAQAAQAAGDRDCGDFDGDQAAAQDYFDTNGGSPTNNVDNLDADGDGIACEQLSDTPQGGIDSGGGGTAQPASIGVGLPLGVAGALLLVATGIAAARRPTP